MNSQRVCSEGVMFDSLAEKAGINLWIVILIRGERCAVSLVY